MKAKNDVEVRKAYLKFSYFLMACIVWAVLIFSCFLKTSSVEVKRIMEKAAEYDHIYAKEVEMSASVDSVYQYMALMNTSPRINDLLLQSVVSTRKMNLMRSLSQFDVKDCKLYSHLLNNLNLFLSARDSIRILNIQEEMVRKDLMQCIQDNWKTRRNLNIGNNQTRNNQTNK